MLKMHKIDFKILKILCAITEEEDSLTIFEIMNILREKGENPSRSTTYRHIQKLIAEEMVGIGAMVDHADTFYILSRGKRFIETGII